jgi:hypothetical protein
MARTGSDRAGFTSSEGRKGERGRREKRGLGNGDRSARSDGERHRDMDTDEDGDEEMRRWGDEDGCTQISCQVLVVATADILLNLISV